MEREVVVDVCAAPDPLVIACGGGTVVDPDNRRRLRASGSRGVAARADRGARRARRQRREPAAARRRSRGRARPGSRRCGKTRTPTAADAVVDTDGPRVDAVADAVLAAFAEAAS